jgi:insertion element IS1 protein InsB
MQKSPARHVHHWTSSRMAKPPERKQRYLCKECGRQFICDYTYLDCLEAVRAMSVPMTINGAGIRDNARVLLSSPNTVLKTLAMAAQALDEPAPPARVVALELDEFWSFVGNKKRQRWTWYGFDRQRRQVIAFVNARRMDAACQPLVAKLQGCQVGRY